ncbi:MULTISPECIES: ANR family transcriptional regulator [Vibrio]|uniref:ANR family transcriptional regulator n=1 Tax=Vibrio spartinae TaxID=1918945 RepID=A0A1N6M632_9VIBR|nr:MULTISPECIES: ANR family transcriptional regulator [Vibrio]WNJ96563.1 ANR family transcriptional regulator [Vibrio ruber]SIO94817.1 hypothetical protein VSP9026_02547 [Vibrio spartinae]
MKREPSEYLSYAQHAVKLEQSGNLTDAAFAWSCAAQQARRHQNRQWAECRSDWCCKWSVRIGKRAVA